MQQSDDSTSSFGTAMTICAWIVGLALLGLFFQDFLSEQYNPNHSPDSQKLNGRTAVILKRNIYGHYVTTGQINGEDVVFLVDTGATNVSVPAAIAQQLGLRKGQPRQMQTANGVVTAYGTVIDELQIGDIRLQNVQGNINPGMTDDDILLGMSVLKQLEFTQRGDTLTLKTL